MLISTSGLSFVNSSNIWGSSAPSAPCVQISRVPVAGSSSTFVEAPASPPPLSPPRPQPVSSRAPDVTSAIPSIVARRREVVWKCIAIISLVGRGTAGSEGSGDRARDAHRERGSGERRVARQRGRDHAVAGEIQVVEAPDTAVRVHDARAVVIGPHPDGAGVVQGCPG